MVGDKDQASESVAMVGLDIQEQIERIKKRLGDEFAETVTQDGQIVLSHNMKWALEPTDMKVTLTPGDYWLKIEVKVSHGDARQRVVELINEIGKGQVLAL